MGFTLPLEARKNKKKANTFDCICVIDISDISVVCRHEVKCILIKVKHTEMYRISKSITFGYGCKRQQNILSV